MTKDLKSYSLDELEDLIVATGHKKYLAGYIFSFIHTRGVTDIGAITPISKSLRSWLVENRFFISQLEVVKKLTDPDGTVKYVLGLPDGERIESVLLFDDGRRTLCVSTQVGCGLGCAFCATGRFGYRRDLSAGEIVDQVNVICRDSKISNVVFMGMGEPLANYDAVLKAVRMLNHPRGRNIGIRHLTISTCGVVEGIERLAEEDIQPRLAISLNAPTDAIRRKLMPIARKYPLSRLLAAVDLYQRKTRNRVTFEYCMIKGINDTVLHARLLVKRLRGIMCNINLIEYNPPGVNSGLQGMLEVGDSYSSKLVRGKMRPSAPEAIERFAKVLREAGFETTVRRKYGQAISAACGQLGAGLR